VKNRPHEFGTIAGEHLYMNIDGADASAIRTMNLVRSDLSRMKSGGNITTEEEVEKEDKTNDPVRTAVDKKILKETLQEENGEGLLCHYRQLPRHRHR